MIIYSQFDLNTKDYDDNAGVDNLTVRKATDDRWKFFKGQTQGYN